MGWLFLLNPNLTTEQVSRLIDARIEHQRRMGSLIIAGMERLVHAEGLSSEAKLSAVTSYIATVNGLLLW